MPRYKVFTNETAIKRVHAFFANDPPYMTHGWLDEPREIKCYIFCDDDKIEKAIVLLSKCDNDPFHTHKRPFILDWIYTFPEHRRNGFATQLLSHVNQLEQTTAFCNNQASEDLFTNVGYVYKGIVNDLPIYRYP